MMRRLIILVLVMLTAAAAAAHAQDSSAKPSASPPTKTAQEAAPANPQAKDANGALKAAGIRVEIKRILARPDFRLAQTTEPKELPAWLRAIRDAWHKFWNRFSEGSAHIADNMPWLPYAVIAVAGAVLLLMTWRVISESFFERKAALAGAKQADGLTPQKLYSLALAAYADGDMQQAIRLLFRAAILSLFGESARTTPTYMLTAKLATIENAPREDFFLLKRSFETTFYGGVAATKNDFENARAIALKLRRVNEEVTDES
jgi:hypothetical protein